MFVKKNPIKSLHDINISAAKGNALPEVALAAIVSYKNQKDVGDFMNFFLGVLDRNADWLNGVVAKQTNFRCALMVGAGPNRFHLQEVIYPSTENILLEVEHRDSEDYDKVAVAALMDLSNIGIDNLLKCFKKRLSDNPILNQDLVKGKEMGISFAVLRPFIDNQYRIMERIVIGSSTKCAVPVKKRGRDEKSIAWTPLKKVKRVF